MLARNIHDEDTIELQLSPAELEGLTQAAAAAEVEAAEGTLPPIVAVPSGAPVPTNMAAPERPAVTRASIPAARTPAALSTPVALAPVTSTPVAERVSAGWPVAATVAVPKAVPSITVERAPALVPAPNTAASSKPMAAKPAPRSTTATAPGQVQRIPQLHQVGQPLALRLAAAAAVAFVAAIAIFYWPTSSTSDRVTTPAVAPPSIIGAPAHQATPQPAAAPPATQLTTSEPPPVRFANPFDSSEVFEFPAGTSYVEARDEVARLLMSRARERNTTPPPPRKTTSTTRPDRVGSESSFARQL